MRSGSRAGGVLAAALCLGAALAAASGALALESPARQVILIDDVTGTTLFEKNADESMVPSSMSKIMTIYMIFERLAEGGLKLDDTLPVSEKAWKKGGSKMFVGLGKRVSIEDLLRGIIVHSGNDASIVIAEGFAGDEESFAAEMTRRSREIGLRDSVFKNASGWPEDGHLVTARDLAVLTRRTIHDFPQYYPYYAEKSFTYNGIRQGNRNPLLYKDIGADGLKTGHTEAAGYGLAASVVRDGRRLIVIVNGLGSARKRAYEAERLIEYGFREFGNYTLFEAGETVVEAHVWLGEAATVPLVVEEDLVTTLGRKARRGLQVKAVYDGPVPAPIMKGTPLGRLLITAPDTDPIEIPLLAGADVDKLGPFRRIGSAVGYLIWGAAPP